MFFRRSSFFFTSPKKYNGEILINFEPQEQNQKKPLLKTCSDGEIIRRKNMEKEEKESTVSDCEICYQNISDEEDENSDKSSHTSTKPSSNKQLVKYLYCFFLRVAYIKVFNFSNTSIST